MQGNDGSSDDPRDLQRTLGQDEALLRVASRLGRLGGWAMDLETGAHHWSDEMFELLGFDLDDLPSLEQAMNLYPPESRPLVERALQRCEHEGMPFDLEVQIRDARGQPFWARVVGEPHRDGDGRIRHIIGAFQDITQRKREEAQHRQLAERLNATLENMSDAFYLLDPDWNFVYVNSEAEHVLQLPREELIGRNVWEMFPGARNTILYDAYHRAVREGKSEHLEFFYEPLQHWFDVNAYPSEEGLAVYFRTITEQRAMEERLQQTQRLESIGQLTGGVAHDFNNLLTVILGNGELLTEALADDARLHPVAEVITNAAQRGSDLTQRLLAFARRQPLEPQPVDANRLLADMDPLLRRTLGDHVDIELTRGAGLWQALADPSQLENAVLNLCLNARDAMPNSGRLTIETANMWLNQDYAAAHGDVEPGQYVMVAVSDTGVGIPESELSRVFEPFYTTKKAGRGTGLGLSMIFGFVKQSRGHIKIYSEPGQGTTVRMYLPRYAGEPASYQAPPLEERNHTGTETVLMVEDDDLVRAYAERELQALGYQVLSAGNGPEALDILQRRGDVELLFTDVVMSGGMSGRDLADEAARLRPGLKVLYTSGYTENAIVHHGRLDPGVHLLSKPYRRADLARKVRAVLDKRVS